MNKTRRITNKSEDKFVLTVECDMSSLTPEQVEEYAFDAIWIKEQAKLRESSSKTLDGYEGRYIFTAEPKGTKGVKDPVKAAINSIGNMSEEQKQELRDALK